LPGVEQKPRAQNTSDAANNQLASPLAHRDTFSGVASSTAIAPIYARGGGNYNGTSASMETMAMDAWRRVNQEMLG